MLFYAGAIMVDNGQVNYGDFFTAMFAVMFGAFGVGQVRGQIEVRLVDRRMQYTRTPDKSCKLTRKVALIGAWQQCTNRTEKLLEQAM